MLNPQNFSVHANARLDVTIDIDPDDDITLVGAVVEWNVYEQQYGQPYGSAIISKNNRVGGTLVVDDPDEAVLTVPLESSDTSDLDPKNYYHECTVVDPSRGNVPVAYGIMTVLETKNRPEETTT